MKFRHYFQSIKDSKWLFMQTVFSDRVAFQLILQWSRIGLQTLGVMSVPILTWKKTCSATRHSYCQVEVTYKLLPWQVGSVLVHITLACISAISRSARGRRGWAARTAKLSRADGEIEPPQMSPSQHKLQGINPDPQDTNPAEFMPQFLFPRRGNRNIDFQPWFLMVDRYNLADSTKSALTWRFSCANYIFAFS